jgi:hypothetical protein
MIHGQGSFNQHPRTISDGGAADQGLAYDDYDDNEDDEDDEEEWDFEQHEEQGEEQGEGEWEGLDAPVDTPGEWVSREDFGGRKSHGYFACSCGKWWYSAHTFRDFVQGCLQCEVGSLPLAMWVDFEEEEEEEEEEHIQSNYCRVCEQEDSHGNYCQACGRSECQEYDDNNGGYNDYDEY